jgi:hypothetical protein
MPTEKRTLLDHADRCRRVAREIEHVRAIERLITMAQEYEARAAMIADEEREQQMPGINAVTDASALKQSRTTILHMRPAQISIRKKPIEHLKETCAMMGIVEKEAPRGQRM